MPARAAATTSQRRGRRAYRTGRQPWLDAALETLRREGIDNVRVERLAHDLGVSKGSFYWEFKTRRDLLHAMLDFWEKDLTMDVLRAFSRPDSDSPPVDRVLAVLEKVFVGKLDRYDAAVRAWGRVDRAVADRVRSVDRGRLAFLSEMLGESGFDSREAKLRAELLYGYIVGSPAIMRRRRRDVWANDLRAKLRVLFES